MVVRGRIQNHVIKKYFTGYLIFLAILFVVALIASLKAQDSPSDSIPWWYYDIPWMFLTVVAWFPIIQLAYYRKTFVTAELYEYEHRCHIDDNKFAGVWTIRNKYPQRMVIAQAGSIILSVFVVLMLIVDLSMVHFVWHTDVLRTRVVSRVNAIQSLCLPIILMSILVRFWTYWKYPNAVALHRQGEWLSFQFRDTPRSQRLR